MDANLMAAGQRKIETVIKNLAKRNINGHYCETKEDAFAYLCSSIEELRKGSSNDFMVSWGGSMTLGELGIKEWLEDQGINTIEPFTPDATQSYQNRLKSLSSDVFMLSTNAITMDGELVNIDGTGNRVSGLIFGPKKVFVIAGTNKLVSTLDEAEARIKSCACPPNAIRLKKKTPCTLTGECADCMIPGETVCANIVITRFCTTNGRIEVLLVNECLGY